MYLLARQAWCGVGSGHAPGDLNTLCHMAICDLSSVYEPSEILAFHTVGLRLPRVEGPIAPNMFILGRTTSFI
jgi:hypothetical protein